MKVFAVLWRINAKIVSGASFCQVARIRQDIQEREVITDGNQKWNGAIPSFNKIADISKRFIWGIEEEAHWVILVISIRLDPSAWAIKYLIAASVSWLDFELVIIGINLSILISIAIHRKIQLELDKAIIDLRIRVDEVIKINGFLV